MIISEKEHGIIFGRDTISFKGSVILDTNFKGLEQKHLWLMKQLIEGVVNLGVAVFQADFLILSLIIVIKNVKDGQKQEEDYFSLGS